MESGLFSYQFETIALEHLKKALNDSDAKFKKGQLDAILNIVKDRKKLLLVQRTGWGKSMVYFIATKILRDPNYYQLHLNQENPSPGPALMISPLLSLMRNQVHYGSEVINLNRYDSSQTSKDTQIAKEDFVNSDLDLLIISPERLSNFNFVNSVLAPVANKISLLIIDEAHCISDWGHDFRPDYMRINSIIANLAPNTPLVATTATANDRVINDVSDQFGEETKILRGQLSRSSLKLVTKKMPSEEERLAFISNLIPLMDGSGIIYTLTIRNAERVAVWLKINGIRAEAYHAGLSNEDRILRENKLLNDELDVIVATSALGMGFDKPNLKYVIHFQTPQSAVHYYQQVGRAGRKLKDAYGICLQGSEDERINSYFIENAFPRREVFENIVNILSKVQKPLTKQNIQYSCNYPPKQIEAALKILSSMDDAPITQNDNNEWQRTPNPLQINWERVSEIKQLRIKEWEEMKAYIQTQECHMLFLAKKLGDPANNPCNRCDSCKEIKFETVDSESMNKASEFLNHLNIPIKPRKKWMKPDFVHYEKFIGNIKIEESVMEGRALCHLSDPLHGKMVIDGKNDLDFNEELIKAAADLISDKRRWGENKNFSWVTCIPSNNKELLVPQLAKKIALKLDLPFVEAIKKIKDTKPQKTMHTSRYKKENLDGAFEIINKDLIPNTGNVLLIDDIVESGWTFTIAGALLKCAGPGDVFPFALAYRKGDAVIDKYLDNNDNE